VAPGRPASRRGNGRARRRASAGRGIGLAWHQAAIVGAVAVVASLGFVVFGSDDGRTSQPAARDRELAVPGVSASIPGVTSAQAGAPTTPPSATAAGGGPTQAPSTAPIRTTPTGAVPPAGKTSSPQVATFAAVSGESCPQNSEHGYRVSGWASDWYSRSSGGWRSDGCGGQVVAVPMSGSATQDDPDNIIVWWFRPAAVRAGSCSVGVYVPDTGDPKDAAGKPAHYLVRAGADIDGDVIGQFDVNQSANQGRWVDAGSYGMTTGKLSVQLVTRGIDFGSGRDGDHLGVSALRVSCQAH
jgi:hypothetical protein